ncbi:DMT family transporter [Desulfofustis limnaeus]|uniref:DMT family transporter n=1 Tax=Desulfofustis limnaeus TaxID=2740163 RepID=UPI0024DFC3DC|nr:DMT family transporter [Desulfofustis limnaeus]
MPAPPPHHRPLLFIFIGAIFISFSGIWVTWSNTDPTVSAFYRVFFGALFLAVAALIRKEWRWLTTGETLLVLLCGLCFAIDLYCWHASIQFIGPGLATIIGNFQVFVLTLVSVLFFGQKIRPVFYLSLPLAFLGLYLIIGFSWSTLSADYRAGIYLGLATALFYSAFLLTLRKIQQTQQAISFFYGLMLASAASALFLGLMILFSGASWQIPGLLPLGSLLCLALFSQTIGWAFIANSLPKAIPSVAGLILLLQPALAFIWDVLIFDRPTSLLQWVGVLITLVAIYLGMSANRPETRQRPQEQ